MNEELKTYLKTEGGDFLKSMINPNYKFKKFMELMLRNTEGQGNVTEDGLSILTGPFRSNYYDGKIHTTGKPILNRPVGASSFYFSNENYDPSHNHIRLFTLKDTNGFQKSKHDAGVYKNTKYEKLPAYEENYYNIEHLEIPEYMKPYIDQLNGKHVSINKDILLKSRNIDFDNTYDARNHYVSIYGDNKNPNIRFDDVFDISLDWVNKLNNPYRLTQVLSSEYVPGNKESDATRATEDILSKILETHFENYLPEITVFPDNK